MGYYGGNGRSKGCNLYRPRSPAAKSAGLSDRFADWPGRLRQLGTSATWTVPTTATSGIYFAKATRTDTGGASHIFFIVRDDDGGSNLLFQTSDTTWQAYNRYGGNSLYTGNPAGRRVQGQLQPAVHAPASYAPEDWVFNAEYPMVRWLEANGFDVSYTTGVDTDRLRLGAFSSTACSCRSDTTSTGRVQQRTNVEAARGAGVTPGVLQRQRDLLEDPVGEQHRGTGQSAYRTLVSYKETHANAKIDPLPNVWTGTWRDPRFSPPADGGRPENALSGTIFFVNSGTTGIRVPEADGKMRFWRNTTVASLGPGGVATMPTGRWVTSGMRIATTGSDPPGLIRMSDTTVSGVDYLQDFGSTYGPGTANHALTLYKHSSGALVFGAGTVQWSWGLDSNHDRGCSAGSPHAAGDRQPVRGYGRAAADTADRG